LLNQISKADLKWVLISLSLEPFLLFASVIKWHILLRSKKTQVTRLRLSGLYLVGRFFNNFLPSTVGGDVVRAYELGNYTKDHTEAFASVFVERFTGLVTLVGLALISFLSHQRLTNDSRIILVMAIAVAGLLTLVWLILDTRPLALVENKISFNLFQRIVPKLKKIQLSLQSYKDDKRTLLLAIFWSFIFMFLAIANVYTSARAFHSPISFLDIAIIVPIILVVAMMPLTFNGLGIQEWAYVILFEWIGLPASVGLSTIILIRGKNFLVAAIGGIVYPYLKLAKENMVPSSEINQIGD